MPRTHYVYVSFRRETRQFYIGCRSGFSVGDDYFGSGIWVRCMLERGVTLEKEVLKTYPNRAAAERAERLLINAFKDHPLCMNSKYKKNWLEPAIKLPPAPPGLSWPPQFHDTEFWRRWHGIKVYLETHWVPFIEHGMIDLEFMRNYYPSAMAGIHQFQGKRGKTPGNILPKHLKIPGRSRRLELFLENPVSDKAA
jgi:hypothetical protein